MRLTLGLLAIVALAGLHIAALFALLHPKVSREYRAYYMDRVSTDWRVQHYSSTPEEGVDFAKRGWPDFVNYSFGILGVEPTGRWTDTRYGLRAGLEFARSFEGPMCVAVDASPFISMRSRKLTLAFGDQKKEISFGQGMAPYTFFVDFDLPSPTKTLALVFPQPLPKASTSNPRQPGVLLKKVRLFSQSCSAVEPSSTASR
jgi:hypothetical protein